jgi:RHH-type proline utilization regulon transcriptional repressor/proline dehydrogenase/delta 1-pyrroline-5-carboxylate dehydrogenase
VQLLESVKGHPLSDLKRQEKSIELASLMLEEAQQIQTHSAKKQEQQLARMMNDPSGKAFTTSMTDQCFRSSSYKRVADQLVFLIKKFGIPHFLDPFKKIGLFLFRELGRPLSALTVPLVKQMLRQQMSNVILPGEPEALKKHMEKRRQDGVRVNLNHLGEAILGEEEAERRLKVYLDDLANPEVEYISIKASTLFSQISLLAWEETLQVLGYRLKLLYREAKKHLYTLPNGKKVPKFVNLDMEEYKDLHLTVELFRRVLDDEEFYQHSAGIVLQAYLPDAFLFQQELTLWAMQRIRHGGAPIKIRLVKGANLAMEQVESALKGWPQAPYLSKSEVDANYIRMIQYACDPEKAKAVHIGIGSHNLFDIAYALLLRAEKGLEKYIAFEMLEGMADHIRRVVQRLSGSILLYCPASRRTEFQNAIAYLMRRLDENTAPENFLRHIFDMRPGTQEWKHQAELFASSCQQAQDVSERPRRSQSRLQPPIRLPFETPFTNEEDTDWALPQNIKWAAGILRTWRDRPPVTIPVCVGGKEISSDIPLESKMDPSNPKKELYRYCLANEHHLNTALDTARKALQKWSQEPLRQRLLLIDNIGYQLRCHRSDLIGVMVSDTAKTVAEADTEISEAIDFASYYRRSVEELYFMEDITWSPKGTVLVAPPWNFPCSIPAGGILAALAAGNTVIFKPAPEAVLVGWELVQIFWKAGISKEVLQFFCCADDPTGTQLIKDSRLDVVVLTGATSTAKHFLKLRPDLDLIAETGGKNALIITNMADRDLAIKDLLHSAFGHAGQKCSACSLAILEGEVYDDPHFKQQLLDAAASLKAGSPWNMSTKVNPLIRAPGTELLRGLTSLEEGEKWLLEPKQDKDNPHLWSPGIKLGVKPGSFTHTTELFGPLLGLMRADSLEHAIKLANDTPYGLTSGLHSLDPREQQLWSEKIIAGNCYINRTITGAIVRRQPFGGCKDSSFGPGAKAGGPNYIIQLMNATPVSLPKEKEPLPEAIHTVDRWVKEQAPRDEELESWSAAIRNYMYAWNHYFSRAHDPSRVKGQHNRLQYVPHRDLVLRVQESTSLFDLLKCMIIAHICKCPLELSISPDHQILLPQDILQTVSPLKITEETEAQLIQRIQAKDIRRLRLLSEPSDSLQRALAETACHVVTAPVLANGRLELLKFLREVSFSIDYHRYGYIYES